MANLFKGFKQVLGTTYSQTSEQDKIGYIWFVRTVKDDTTEEEQKSPLLNDSYDIYFGTKHYGHFMEGEITTLSTAINRIKEEVGLGGNYEFTNASEIINGSASVNDALTKICTKIGDVETAFNGYKSSNDKAVAAKAVDIVYTKNDSSKDNHATLKLLLGNGQYTAPIDVQDFIYDGILEDAKLVEVKDNAEVIGEGQTTPISGQTVADGTYIKLIFKQEGSGLNKQPIYLDVKGLIDVYTGADDTIVIEGNKVKVGVVPAAQTETKKAITVKGGPLADLLNKKGINQIDANTNMEALLTQLFFEELWSKKPTFSDDSASYKVYFNELSGISLSQSGTVEVGTKVTASAYTAVAPVHNTPKRTYSGFEYGYAKTAEGPVQPGQPASVSAKDFAPKGGNFTLTRTHSGFSESTIDASVSNETVSNCKVDKTEELTVNVGTNSVTYTVSGPGFTGNIPAEEGHYYHASNVGAFDESHKIARGGLVSLDKDPDAKSKTVSITGKRFAFIGQKDEALVSIDGASVRTLTPKSSLANSFDMTIKNGARRVYICLPSSWNKTLKSVKDEVAMGAQLVGKFLPTTVAVEGANGYATENYTVYCYAPDTVLGDNTYHIELQ